MTTKQAQALSSRQCLFYAKLKELLIEGHVFAAFTSAIFISQLAENTALPLTAPKNDLVELLRLSRYSHGAANQHIYPLTDYSMVYADMKGVERQLEAAEMTEANIAATVALATSRPGKCLIIFMGHMYKSQEGRAFFLTSEGNRVFGKKFLSWVTPSSDPDSPLLLLLDACHSAAFIESSFVCDGGIPCQRKFSIDPENPDPSVKDRPLVIIAAARSGQVANAITYDDKNRHGAMLILLIRFLQRKGNGGAAKATDIVTYLLKALGGAKSLQQPLVTFSTRSLENTPISLF